jgi:serine phosphatase RsbU (regulator of sigma subunit)
MSISSKFRFILLIAILSIAALLLLGITLWGHLPIIGFGLKCLALAWGLLLVIWVFWSGLRSLLWRVGRRLAFSYFLIGVLPIPMVMLLAGLNGYLLSGYFMGHLFRDAVHSIHSELQSAAEDRLARLIENPDLSLQPIENMAFAYYSDGRRISGDDRLPRAWPRWLKSDPGNVSDSTAERELSHSFVALPNGTPTIAATASNQNKGVLAVFDREIEQELAARSHIWVSLLRADDPRKEASLNLNLGGKKYTLQPLRPKRSYAERSLFFGTDEEQEHFWQRPIIWWAELSGPFYDLCDGRLVAEYLAASLNGRLQTVYRHLFSTSAEVDTAVWASLITLTGLLSTFYLTALAMAFYMIFSLSRAVNRLSLATESVKKGDFSGRIRTRRKDQVGELQQSFNQMSGNLERLIATAAQKEILENELAIARQLQESLLPDDLPMSDTVDFATLFEPSAAIGGDYFDILRLDEHRLAIVIADVSGHGLPTGLRMAMLKAALVILVEESKPPEEILRRLHNMVRSEHKQRFFVTATIAVVDFRTGLMQLTNAGHPPTYVVRERDVEEIVLPGSPLGALGETYGHHQMDLLAGDIVVWLSDGLIEATNAAGDPFGYDRTRAALLGPSTNATEVRNRLLSAVEAHAGGHPAEDDRTLVAMRFRATSATGDKSMG